MNQENFDRFCLAYGVKNFSEWIEMYLKRVILPDDEKAILIKNLLDVCQDPVNFNRFIEKTYYMTQDGPYPKFFNLVQSWKELVELELKEFEEQSKL